MTLVPVGGLANRMKVIDSAVSLWRNTGIRVEVIWFERAELKCRYAELFEKIRCEGVNVREATLADRVLYDRPRRKNLWLPLVLQSVAFDCRMYEREATGLFHENFDFASWISCRNVYIAACERVYAPVDGDSLFADFIPVESLRQAIEDRCALFDNHTVGVHVRRTDNVAAIDKSPTCLFVERMKREVDRDENVRFYLATDSDDEKRDFLRLFGNRIITSPMTADRKSVAGMQEALVELYTLSRTDLIIGSAHSTFSETAAQIGGIGCEILSR